MVDLRRYQLHNGISKDMLFENGFKQISKNVFILAQYLYKHTIEMQMFVNLSSGEIEIEVFNRNTGSAYFPFWNNISGENNLVALEVIKNFNLYIEELKKEGVLEDNNGESSKNN